MPPRVHFTSLLFFCFLVRSANAVLKCYSTGRSTLETFTFKRANTKQQTSPSSVAGDKKFFFWLFSYNVAGEQLK